MARRLLWLLIAVIATAVPAALLLWHPEPPPAPLPVGAWAEATLHVRGIH